MVVVHICGRDRPIYRPGRYLGFTDISLSAKTANFIGLSRCWQNAVIFLTHPDNLRKKAQRSKSRQLSYSNASRCGFINKQTRLTIEHASVVAAETKASLRSFINAWSYHVQVLCMNKLPLHFRKFLQHIWLKGAEVQLMPSLAQMNFFKVCMKNELHYAK